MARKVSKVFSRLSRRVSRYRNLPAASQPPTSRTKSSWRSGSSLNEVPSTRLLRAGDRRWRRPHRRRPRVLGRPGYHRREAPCPCRGWSRSCRRAGDRHRAGRVRGAVLAHSWRGTPVPGRATPDSWFVQGAASMTGRGACDRGGLPNKPRSVRPAVGERRSLRRILLDADSRSASTNPTGRTFPPTHRGDCLRLTEVSRTRAAPPPCSSSRPRDEVSDHGTDPHPRRTRAFDESGNGPSAPSR